MTPFLTQHEADQLMKLQKHYRGLKPFLYPTSGNSLRIPLHSSDGREKFSLDIRQGRINFMKNTYQSRARKSIVLARVDIGGPRHVNPDGQEVPCPHIHLYREGYGDRWAVPLAQEFSEISNPLLILDEFMGYCNVVTRPVITPDLFV